MIIPPFLKKADKIRIVAPAGKVDKNKILSGINLLKQDGFDVIIGDHVFDEFFQFAATDEQRIADIQTAIDDPETKAIICARGGYGMVRIIEHLNFSELLKSPKWLVGFSDITVAHAKLNKLEIASIHGSMPGSYLKDDKPTLSYLELIKALKGDSQAFQFNDHRLNRKGTGEGELIGGNLSILYSLRGTPLDISTKDKILFIEDLSEYLYHLDRIMNNLKIGGKLANLAGLVVGQFTDMKDNKSPFGQSAYEIIHEAVTEYDYPVCFDFPAGHIDNNMPLIFGAKYSLNSELNCELKQL